VFLEPRPTAKSDQRHPTGGHQGPVDRPVARCHTQPSAYGSRRWFLLRNNARLEDDILWQRCSVQDAVAFDRLYSSHDGGAADYTGHRGED
jgi:hypothetical protein